MAKKKNAQTVWGGLNFKQFRNAGRRGLEMSDIAWAGRMYSKMPYWNARLNRFTTVLLGVSVLCLGAMWVSVLMRQPALLLGVYPDGEVVCFPRLRTSDGQVSPIHPSYEGLCRRIDERMGKKWQVNNAESISDVSAIGNLKNAVQYTPVKEIEAKIRSAIQTPPQASLGVPSPGVPLSGVPSPGVPSPGIPSATSVQGSALGSGQPVPQTPQALPAQPAPNQLTAPSGSLPPSPPVSGL